MPIKEKKLLLDNRKLRPPAQAPRDLPDDIDVCRCRRRFLRPCCGTLACETGAAVTVPYSKPKLLAGRQFAQRRHGALPQSCRWNTLIKVTAGTTLRKRASRVGENRDGDVAQSQPEERSSGPRIRGPIDRSSVSSSRPSKCSTRAVQLSTPSPLLQ